MRYIDKTGNEPQRLIAWKVRLHERLSTKVADASITGDKLWKLMDDDRTEIDKTGLKEHLVKEQGYLCCYCGARVFPDHNSHVEHLLPKNAHKHLTYDYGNLLVSCMGGSKPVIHVVKAGESAESIAMQYGVDEELLEMVYVDQAFINKTKDDYDLGALKPGDRVVIFPQTSSPERHCGHKKNSNEIGITPLQANVEDHFRYDPRTGQIKITEANTHTVDVLGLNSNPLLNRNRLKRMEKVYSIITRLYSMASGNESGRSAFVRQALSDYCHSLAQKDSHGEYQPWYFVEIASIRQP
jgi:uncharacterized protein (TIGR02646 family)